MSDLKKEFAAMCIARGFKRQGKSFARCIGDGIYQNIGLGYTWHLDPFSPEYTSTHKKDTAITFGFWSLYAELPSFYFDDKRCRNYLGNFLPENLLGKSARHTKFTGFSSHFEIMKSIGFDLLDTVVTQEKLIETVLKLQIAESGEPDLYNYDLCAPYILCGNRREPLRNMLCLYAQNWSAFRHNNGFLRESGQYEAYVKEEIAFEQETKGRWDFMNMVWGNRQEEQKAYILSCLNRNIQLAKENKIPFASNFELLHT